MPDQHASPQLPSRAFLQKLFDSLNEIVCALDVQGRFVYINQASYKIWGYYPHELIGVSCFDLMTEEDREASYQAIHRAYKGEEVPPYENRYYHKDGRIITMYWEGRWNFGGQTSYSTGRDITEQRRLEKLEQEFNKTKGTTKEQLEHLIDRITDGFLGVDDNNRITYWNKAAETLTHVPHELMIGHLVFEVLHEPANSLLRQQLTTVRAQKRSNHTEYFSSHLQRWVEVNAYVSDSGVSLFFRDISERKKLQEQQQKKITAAVIKATEDDRAFVGRELHDNVNQVLTTVKLYNELCLTNTPNREELLSKSVKLLQDSINMIRGLSKRLSPPSLGGVQLRESIGELVEAINITNRLIVHFEHNIENLEVPEEIHTAVYRILQEHFTNILKHAQATAVNVQALQKNQTLKVSVIDDGCGFDPTEYSKGIGIENMISRAQNINGKLELISAPGKGCTLLLSLPIPNNGKSQSE